MVLFPPRAYFLLLGRARAGGGLSTARPSDSTDQGVRRLVGDARRLRAGGRRVKTVPSLRIAGGIVFEATSCSARTEEYWNREETAEGSTEQM